VWYLVVRARLRGGYGNATVMSGTIQVRRFPPRVLAYRTSRFLLGGTITPVLPTVTNEIDVASRRAGGVFAQEYESNGPMACPGRGIQRRVYIDPSTDALREIRGLRTEHDGLLHLVPYDPNNRRSILSTFSELGSAGVDWRRQDRAGGVNLGLVQSSEMPSPIPTQM